MRIKDALVNMRTGNKEVMEEEILYLVLVGSGSFLFFFYYEFTAFVIVRRSVRSAVSSTLN